MNSLARRARYTAVYLRDRLPVVRVAQVGAYQADVLFFAPGLALREQSLLEIVSEAAATAHSRGSGSTSPTRRRFRTRRDFFDDSRRLFGRTGPSVSSMNCRHAELWADFSAASRRRRRGIPAVASAWPFLRPLALCPLLWRVPLPLLPRSPLPEVQPQPVSLCAEQAPVSIIPSQPKQKKKRREKLVVTRGHGIFL